MINIATDPGQMLVNRARAFVLRSAPGAMSGLIYSLDSEAAREVTVSEDASRAAAAYLRPLVRSGLIDKRGLESEFGAETASLATSLAYQA